MKPWEKYGSQEQQAAPAKPWEAYGGKQDVATEQGVLWPVSKDAQGNLQFDSDAGLLGLAKRAFTLPYDVYRGNVQMTDPATGRTSDEAIGRALEAGSVMTPVNPAVRSGDMLVPGVAKAMQKAEPPVPTADQLLKAGSQGFDEMRATGAVYPSSAVKKMAQETMARMEAEGFDETVAPKTFATLKAMAEPPAGSYASINNMHSARKRFGKIAGNFNDPTEQAAASMARGGLDDFVGGYGDMAVPPVSPEAARTGAVGQALAARKAAAENLNTANANYAAGKRSDTVQGIERAADLRAAAANSGQNTGNAIRQRVASALLKQKDTAGFSANEKDALEAIVRGSRGANATRAAGNILGGGGGLGSMVTAGIGGGTGAMFGGPVGAAVGATVPPALGGLLKGTSTRITQKALQNADELIRKRSPLYEALLRDAPMVATRDAKAEAIIRALVAGQTGQAN